MRKRARLTQDDLAARVHKSRPTITCYESGARSPDKSTLALMAAELGASVDYLLGRTDERQPGQVREKTAVELYDDVASLTPAELEEWRRYADWLKERRKRKGPSHHPHPETPQT